jgi:radical SAM protein with 4Fe4S-binding SPASM domain
MQLASVLKRVAREYIPEPFYKKLGAMKNRLFSDEATDTVVLDEASDAVALEHLLSISRRRPLDINIETTSYCALSCTFCPNKTHRRTKALMDMSSFVRICDEYYAMGGGAVGLSSMQSDVFADNLLMERIALLKKYKDRFWVHTTTNLVGAKKLSETEMITFLETLDFIEISFGGPDREDYRSMFGVDALDSVLKQLARILNVIRARNLKLRVEIAVRTHDREKFLKSELYKNLSEEKTISVSHIKDTFFSWGGLVVQDHLPTGARLAEPIRTTGVDCVVPWAELSINVDGSVVGCGCVDWNAQHVVGNVFTHSIAEVWNSKSAKAFRTAFSSGAVPALCRNCALYHPIDSGFGRKSLRNYEPTDGLYYVVR